MAVTPSLSDVVDVVRALAPVVGGIVEACARRRNESPIAVSIRSLAGSLADLTRAVDALALHVSDLDRRLTVIESRPVASRKGG